MQLGKPKTMKVESSLSPPQVTEVSAYPIICDDLSVQLMVHKDHNRHHKYPGWLVSEHSTGVRIGNNHRTRREAVIDAVDKVKTVGPDMTNHCIKKLKVLNA